MFAQTSHIATHRFVARPCRFVEETDVMKYGMTRFSIVWVVASAITSSEIATRLRTCTPKCSKSGSATV